MALLPVAYLTHTVSADPLVMESPEAMILAVEAIQYSESHGAERAAAERDGRFRRRKPVSSGELMEVGGYSGYGGGSDLKTKSAKWYDESVGQWRALPDMSAARYGCAAVRIEGNVYVVGGTDGNAVLKSAEMYDASTGQWRTLSDMSVPRIGCAAVCIEGNVVVLGGYDGEDDLKSAEVYDTSAGHWRALPDMSVPRLGCAAVCIEGKVHVMGGENGESALKSAEVYDTHHLFISAGKWRALPDMSVGRVNFAAVCVEGNIYVLGGRDDDSPLKSAEVYDASAGQWRALPNMSVARFECSAVCIEGKVYVVGGRDSIKRHTSMERYDPLTNEWRTQPSINS
jgi:kelch-like protein 8